MDVPNFLPERVIDENGYWTEPWKSLMEQLLQNMQTDLGNEGFVNPSVSSDPTSVTPNAAGGQLQQVQSSFGQQNGVIAGTIIFDPYEVNGAVLPARNGQLKVLLNDGTFHPITNT
jgi:hypothetical protein